MCDDEVGLAYDVNGIIASITPLIPPSVNSQKAEREYRRPCAARRATASPATRRSQIPVGIAIAVIIIGIRIHGAIPDEHDAPRP
jgi:hypothetical protein